MECEATPSRKPTPLPLNSKLDTDPPGGGGFSCLLSGGTDGPCSHGTQAPAAIPRGRLCVRFGPSGTKVGTGISEGDTRLGAEPRRRVLLHSSGIGASEKFVGELVGVSLF